MKLTAIQEAVVKSTGFTLEELSGKSRIRPLSDARKIYCKLARTYTEFSWYAIGQSIKKDHATVMHNARACDSLMQYDKKFAKKMHSCMDEIEFEDEMFYTYIDEY